MILPVIAHVLLVVFAVLFSIWFYRTVRSPKNYFEKGLDLKNEVNDRLLVASVVTWLVVMIIVLSIM